MQRRAGHRQQQRVEQLDLAAVVAEQRRQAAADAQIDAHPLVGGIELPQVVALLVGDHLRGHLVVVAQEDRPLAALGDLGGLAHDVGDGVPVLLRERHVDARHQGEMERHVAFIPVAEVLRGFFRPLVGLGEQHAVGIVLVDRRADGFQHRVRLGEVLAIGPLALARGRGSRRGAARRRRGRASSAWCRAPPRSPAGCRS